MQDETKRMINNELLEKHGYEVAYIIDINSALWGTSYEGIPVISPFDGIKKYKNGDFSKIVLPGATVEWDLRNGYFDEVSRMGYGHSDILWGSVELFNGVDTEYPLISDEDFSYLDYLEFHTNDHCNLNCKNCNNFSNYVKGERYYDFNTFERDIKQLKSIVSHILEIRVLGGEPLLNKDVHKYLNTVREVFPYADIHLVTNGILIPQISELVADTLVKTDAIVEISAYPVMFDKIDETVGFLNGKGIRNRIGWIGQSFLPPIIDRYNYPLTTVDCRCIHIRDGKVARCPLIQYIDDYNQANGTSFDSQKGVIDIYEEGLTFKEFNKRLCSPFELCNYCGFWRKDLPQEEWSCKQ